MKFGYARADNMEDMARQESLIIDFNVDQYYKDFVTDNNDFTALHERINLLSRGTIFFVDSITYISTNITQLIDVINKLNDKGIKLISLYPSLETRSFYGRGIQKILCAAKELAELEEMNYYDTPVYDAISKIRNGLSLIDLQYKKKYGIKKKGVN